MNRTYTLTVDGKVIATMDGPSRAEATKRLRRRADHLGKILADYRGRDDSYARAEWAALQVAIAELSDREPDDERR
jgi:hypothetical protein